MLTGGLAQIREGFIVDEDEEDDAEDSDERRRRRKKRRRAEREQEEVLDEEDLDLIGEANPNFQRREQTQVHPHRPVELACRKLRLTLMMCAVPVQAPQARSRRR